MARYIDADLIKPSEIIIPCGNGTYQCVEAVYMDDIREIPTADVAEVVFCQKCKYAKEIHYNNAVILKCTHDYGHGKYVENFGFCYWGKRREDG